MTPHSWPFALPTRRLCPVGFPKLGFDRHASPTGSADRLLSGPCAISACLKGVLSATVSGKPQSSTPVVSGGHNLYPSARSFDPDHPLCLSNRGYCVPGLHRLYRRDLVAACCWCLSLHYRGAIPAPSSCIPGSPLAGGRAFSGYRFPVLVGTSC